MKISYKLGMTVLFAGLLVFSSCKKEEECDEVTWYLDSDGDGLGDPNVTTKACEQPGGYVDNGIDLDDSQSGVNDITNENKAIAVLNGFVSGDATAIMTYMSAIDFTQHNLTFGDGRAFIISRMDNGYYDNISIDIVRTFTDDNVVVIHSKYGGAWNNFEPQIVFNVFRFDNGIIVEHWDNLTNEVIDGNGNSQFDGATTPVIDTGLTAVNKTLVSNFYTDLYENGTWSNYVNYIDDDNYVNHSTGVPNGTETFAFLPEGTPLYSEVKYVYGSGNFVLVMSEGFPSSTDVITAYYDLMRVENNRIVEHWDVVQTIEDDSVWLHSNGKW